MTKMFNTETAATAELKDCGFRQTSKGCWISRCKTVRATIHPTRTASVHVVYLDA
jgi:hypothetical protein